MYLALQPESEHISERMPLSGTSAGIRLVRRWRAAVKVVRSLDLTYFCLGRPHARGGDPLAESVAPSVAVPSPRTWG